jgi:GTPase
MTDEPRNTGNTDYEQPDDEQIDEIDTDELDYDADFDSDFDDESDDDESPEIHGEQTDDEEVRRDAGGHAEKDLAHSGFVAVIGKPNVGKSTLMNAILGEKIAIVSPKPQTTRIRQLGILSREDAQVVFVDTPGIHQPKHRLGEFMVQVATNALVDADAILFVVDLTEPPSHEDRHVAAILRDSGTTAPVILALNKLDVTKAENVLPHTEAYTALVPNTDWVTLSARKKAGVDDLVGRLVALLPAGPQYYPDDQLSDTAIRDIAAEIIREKVLLNIEQEIPHAAAVEIEEFKERSETLSYIRATIYVERDSHKAILIGKGGAMLKKISSQARADIEPLTGGQVFLELWVKVLKNWRKDDNLLRRLGYAIPRG